MRVEIVIDDVGAQRGVGQVVDHFGDLVVLDRLAHHVGDLLLAEFVPAGRPQRILEGEAKELPVALGKHSLGLLAQLADEVCRVRNRLNVVLVELRDRIGHSIDCFDSFDKVDENCVDERAQGQEV